MFSIISTEPITIKAIDEIDDNYGNITQYPTKSLPEQIISKFNMLVELYARNYNMKDKLLNDADGIFKAYTNTNEQMN